MRDKNFQYSINEFGLYGKVENIWLGICQLMDDPK